jgi:prolyl-tRNA synthetase
MLWSKLFVPTLREVPAEAASAAHRLLLRAGYIRQLSPSVFGHLFLGRRSLMKIERIAREELDAIGGQEVRLPLHGGGKTMAAIARGELRSYKQLPQIWYHLQATLESCSFDLQDASQLHIARAWRRILQRCVIEHIEADTSWVALSDDGDFPIAYCPSCRFAAPLATAQTRPAPPLAPDPEGDLSPEPFHTPGQKTIADLSVFTNLPETSQMKSLVLVAHKKPVLVMLRGDHQLSDAKFAGVSGDKDFRPAHPSEIVEWFGASVGSLGPVGVSKMPILADTALRGRRNLMSGANRDDYHLRHVTPCEDFTPEWHDVRQATPGDLCPRCEASVEVRKTFELGRSCSTASTDVRVLTADGKETAAAVASYSLDVERILIAAADQHQDQDGLTLPRAIAPFDVVVTPANTKDSAQMDAARQIYQDCLARNIDALLDDRDERPGVKFKDADLIGIPYRVTIGKKLATGVVELVDRRARRTIDEPVESLVMVLVKEAALDIGPKLG